MNNYLKNYCTACWVVILLLLPSWICITMGWTYAIINSGLKTFIWSYNTEEVLFVLVTWVMSIPLTVIWIRNVITKDDNNLCDVAGQLYLKLRSEI